MDYIVKVEEECDNISTYSWKEYTPLWLVFFEKLYHLECIWFIIIIFFEQMKQWKGKTKRLKARYSLLLKI